MISSSNFFRKTLFHEQQKLEQKQLLPSIKKNAISPWQPQEDLSMDLFADQKKTTKEKQSKKQSRKKKNIVQSNLLNTIIEQEPTTNSITVPLTMIKRVPIKVKFRAEESKKKNQINYDSMSIREFLSKQRLEILRLREANRQSIDSRDNAKDFLVKRNYRKMRSTDEHSKTLDLRRELFQPLQIFERKSVLAINPRLKQRRLQFYMVSTDKTNPLYEHRYSLD